MENVTFLDKIEDDFDIEAELKKLATEKIDGNNIASKRELLKKLLPKARMAQVFAIRKHLFACLHETVRNIEVQLNFEVVRSPSGVELIRTTEKLLQSGVLNDNFDSITRPVRSEGPKAQSVQASTQTLTDQSFHVRIQSLTAVSALRGSEQQNTPNPVLEIYNFPQIEEKKRRNFKNDDMFLFFPLTQPVHDKLLENPNISTVDFASIRSKEQEHQPELDSVMELRNVTESDFQMRNSSVLNQLQNLAATHKNSEIDFGTIPERLSSSPAHFNVNENGLPQVLTNAIPEKMDQSGLPDFSHIEIDSIHSVLEPTQASQQIKNWSEVLRPPKNIEYPQVFIEKKKPKRHRHIEVLPSLSTNFVSPLESIIQGSSNNNIRQTNFDAWKNIIKATQNQRKTSCYNPEDLFGEDAEKFDTYKDILEEIIKHKNIDQEKLLSRVKFSERQASYGFRFLSELAEAGIITLQNGRVFLK